MATPKISKLEKRRSKTVMGPNEKAGVRMEGCVRVLAISLGYPCFPCSLPVLLGALGKYLLYIEVEVAGGLKMGRGRAVLRF